MTLKLTETERRELRSLLIERWAKLRALSVHGGTVGDVVARLIEKLDAHP